VQDISTEDEKAHLFLAVLTLTVDHDVMQQPLIVIKKCHCCTVVGHHHPQDAWGRLVHH
jgi:hypothetical protein